MYYIPIQRWKAFNRALKKKEEWAIEFYNCSSFEEILKMKNIDKLIKSLLHTNNFLLVLLKRESLL
jgi:hypothetical protein